MELTAEDSCPRTEQQITAADSTTAKTRNKLILQPLFLPKHFVLVTQDNDFWLVSSGFLRVEQSETHDRQAIPWFSQVRSGSIELDPALTADPVNDVSLKPSSIRHVPHQNALVLFQFDQLGEVRGNAETPFVIYVRGGYNSSMNLRFEERYLHVSQTSD